MINVWPNKIKFKLKKEKGLGADSEVRERAENRVISKARGERVREKVTEIHDRQTANIYV